MCIFKLKWYEEDVKYDFELPKINNKPNWKLIIYF